MAIRIEMLNALQSNEMVKHTLGNLIMESIAAKSKIRKGVSHIKLK